MAEIAGVILAGGLSRRMDGLEKSLIMVGDKPLIRWACDRLSTELERLAINANGDASRFAEIGLPVIADTVEGFAGPLAGVLAAMRWASANTDASALVTAAADTPFFPKDFVSRISACAERENVDVVLAASGGRRHPVFGYWKISLADALERFLVEEEGRKVMAFVERHAWSECEFETGSIDPFFNVNTPQDLNVARKFAETLR